MFKSVIFVKYLFDKQITVTYSYSITQVGFIMIISIMLYLYKKVAVGGNILETQGNILYNGSGILLFKSQYYLSSKLQAEKNLTILMTHLRRNENARLY